MIWTPCLRLTWLEQPLTRDLTILETKRLISRWERLAGRPQSNSPGPVEEVSKQTRKETDRFELLPFDQVEEVAGGSDKGEELKWSKTSEKTSIWVMA